MLTPKSMLDAYMHGSTVREMLPLTGEYLDVFIAEYGYVGQETYRGHQGKVNPYIWTGTDGVLCMLDDYDTEDTVSMSVNGDPIQSKGEAVTLLLLLGGR